LCQQNHTVGYSGNARGVIEFVANVPAMIDCNNSNWYGDDGSSDNGIEFQSSCDNNTVKNCNMHDYGYGVYMDGSSGAGLILGNRFVGNTFNSSLYDNVRFQEYVYYNSFINNSIFDSARHGIEIYTYNDYNNFTGNNFTGNGNAVNEYGIYFEHDSSDWNMVWNNYFDNTYDGYGQAQNHYNVSKITGLNIIGGPWIGGNYWSDHSGGDADGDTISDTSFSLTNAGTDQLPLTSNYTGGCVYLDNQFSFGSNATLATDVYVNDNILLCNGNHSVSNIVYLNASNIVVQGNGAIIKGGTGTLFFLNGSFNNVSLLNFTIEGYDLPLKSNNGGNLLVKDLNVYDNTRVFSIENTNSVEINDTKFENWSMYVSNSNVNLTNVMLYNDYVELNYTSVVLDLPSSSHNTTAEMKLWNNTVIVNSTNIPKFNFSAVLTFRNQGLYAPGPIRNGAECSGSVCTGFVNLGSNDYRYTVTKFTNYSVSNINAAPNVTTSGLNMSGFLNARVHLNASVQDLNGNGTITGVNFSIKDATGNYLLSNDTGVNSSVDWNSSSFVLNKCGTYTSIVEAWDNEGKNTTVVASVDFVCFDMNFNASYGYTEGQVNVYGRVNYTNGSLVNSGKIYGFVDGVLNSSALNIAWWNTSFVSREIYNLSMSTTNDLNFSLLRFNVSTSNLISEGKMENDCGDVRFTDEDGFELNYTIISVSCNSSNTYFWLWDYWNVSEDNIVVMYSGNSLVNLKKDSITSDPSLILYAHLDNDSEYGENSTHVYDFSNHRNGTTSGGARFNETGKYGGGYYFDGKDDLVQFGDQSMYEIKENITIALWFYWHGNWSVGANPGATCMINKDVGWTSGFRICMVADTGKVHWDTGDSGVNKVQSTSGIATDEWHHVVVTYNGTMNKLYLDGVLNNSAAKTAVLTYSNNQLELGRGDSANPSYAYYFNGTIDEVMLYNRTLNDDEIFSIYESTSPIILASPIKTNSSGDYLFNLTFSSVSGTREIKVNSTLGGLYGEAITNFNIYQNPVIDSVVLNATAGLNKNLYLVANVTDENLVGVNFTVVDPSGAEVVNNLGSNGTSAYYQWNSSSFTLNKSGTYNYTVVVWDNDDLEVSTTGQVDFITLSLNLNASYGYTEGQVNVYGRVNYTNGSLVKNGFIYGFVDGVLNTTTAGVDGSLIVTTENYVVNNYTYLMSNQSSSDTQILVNDTSEFSAGDYVMIWQVQNGTGQGNAGTYEFAKIGSISGFNFTLTAGLSNTYGSGVFNASSSSVTQVVRVPQFGDVNVSATGSIVADAWDGWKGGVVVFNSSGTVTVSGEINVTGKGFRGGMLAPGVANYGDGYVGERILGVSTARAADQNSILMGGGAGNGADGAGGGGAYGADGIDGGAGAYGDPGLKGTAYGDANLSYLYFGGGGGSAGSHGSGRLGGPGGAGGGLLMITADTISVSGKVLAVGEKPVNGTQALNADSGAAGGGGAGGAIYLKAVTLSVTGQVNASYGVGGDKDPSAGGGKDGGNGSVGRVRMDFTSLTGASVPVQVNGSFSGVSSGLQTNSSGDYLFNLTFGSASGSRTIKVNASQSGLYGESSSTIMVYGAPVVTIAPADQNYSVDMEYISLNCSVSDDDGGMNNVTFYHDLNGSWINGGTYNLTGNGGSVIHSLDVKDVRGKIVDTNFKWNCLAVDNLSLTDWGTNATVGPWDLGDYNDTFLNASSGYLGLDSNDSKQELSSDWFDMNGNVVLLHLDEASGTLVDASGNEMSGAESGGATYGVDGMLDTALSFDGGDDYVAIANFNSTKYGARTNFTVSSWVKKMETSSGWSNTYGSAQWNTGASPGTNQWILSLTSNGADDVPGFSIEIGSTNYRAGVADEMVLGDWYYLVGTYDGETSRFYVDGVEVGNNTSPSGEINDKNIELRIARGVSASYLVEGFYDEYSIWNRTLESTEILQIYDRQKGYYISNGTYTSRIVDAESSVTWTNMSWDENLPYGEPLPSEQGVESFVGGANMTDNVMLLHMDESSGNITDYSGMNNNGNVSGGVTHGVEGRLGTALEFDGKNDFVTTTYDPLYNNFTFGMWIKPSQLGNRDEFASTSDGSTVSGWYWHSNWDTNDVNKLGMELSAGSWTNCDGVTIDSVVMDKWHYVLFTKSSESGVRMYYDGNLTGNCTTATADIIDEQSTLYIGRGFPDANARYFNGSIDEVSLWNRTLTHEEVIDVYKRGALDLNVSVRNCDDDVCAGDSWVSFGSNATYNNLSNLTASRYFQYRFSYSSLNGDVTPELNLSSVFIAYQPPNLLPVVGNISLVSSDLQNYSNGSLSVSWDVGDADGDSAVLNETKWFINGVLQSSLLNLTSVDSGNLTRGQNWNVSIRSYDGNEWGNWSDNVSLTISSVPSYIENVSLVSSENNYSNGSLSVSWDVGDADGDSAVLNETKWFINGVLQSSLLNLTSVDSGNISKNWVVNVSIRSYDGYVWSSWSSNVSLLVLNSNPHVQNVSLSSTSVNNYSNGSLSVSWDIGDLDGDGGSLNETRWFKDGVLQSSLLNLTLVDSGNLSKSQNWNVSIRSYDGTGWSSWSGNVSLLVLNSNPHLQNVSLSSSSVNNYSNGSLSVSWDIGDLDGDGGILNETRWFKDGVLQSSLLNLTLVDSGNLSKSQNWNVSVRSFVTNSWVSWSGNVSFLVLNSAPYFSHSFEEKLVNVSGTLLYDINCSDLDLDSLSYYDNTTLFEINLTTGVVNVTAQQADVGNHSVLITCGDGTVNASETLSYVVNDSTYPSIVVGSPSAVIIDVNPVLSVNSSENSTCYYKSVTSNYTQLNSIDNLVHNATLSLTYGMHVYTVLCNDTALNSNTTNVYFYLATEVPESFDLNTTNINTSVSSNYTVGNLNLSLNMSGNVSSYLFIGEFENSPINATFNLSGFTTSVVKYFAVETSSEVEGNLTTATFVFSYNDTGVTESDLELYYFNSSNVWQDLDATFDTDVNTATVTLDHMSTFVIATATEIVVVEEEEEVAASSGGGGGGGGSVGQKPVYFAPTVDNFSVSEDSVGFDLAFEESDEKVIVITNDMDTKQQFILSFRGIGNVMTLSEHDFVLDSGESKEVILYAVSDRVAGIKSGSLRIEGDGIINVPVVVEISSHLVLFDGILYINEKDKEVLPGQSLPVKVTLLNVANPRNVDVLLNFVVSDLEGNIISEESQTVAVEGKNSFNKEIFVPSSLEYGTYVLGMEVIYVDSVATATSLFYVVEEVTEDAFDYTIMLYILAGVLIFGFTLLGGILVLLLYLWPSKREQIIS
jgi:hypothetical protein